MQIQDILVAHSPDPDDRSMFWALQSGYIPMPHQFRLRFAEYDTSGLNQLALTGEPDVCAVSVGFYPEIADAYQPLVMGCSVGEAYGPVLVAAPELCPSIVQGHNPIVLLSPGPSTTASRVLKHIGFTFEKEVHVPIVPMSLVFQEMERYREQGIPVAALLIHEGRLTYRHEGYDLVVDLGMEWHKRYSRTLPLGMNVIRRSLALETKRALSSLFYASCEYMLEHQEDLLREYPHRYGSTPLQSEELANYLRLYANAKSLRVDGQTVTDCGFLVEKLFPQSSDASLSKMQEWI